MSDARKPLGEPILAVDFGTAALKVVEAVATDGGIVVRRLARRRITPQDLADPKAAGAALREAVAGAGMEARRALFSLNAATIPVFHREFPKMAAEALEKTCRFELKKEIKYPPEDAVLAVRVLKELDGRDDEGRTQKRVRVMFAAMSSAELLRIEAICQEAGLVAAGVLSASLSLPPLVRKLRLLDGLGPEEVVLFLDFGNAQMTADFISDSSLRFSKSISMGGSALTEVVRALGAKAPIPLEEAEERKFRVGLKTQEELARLDPDDPETNLHKVLNVSFRKIFQRVRLSTGHFFANYKDSTLSTQFMKRIGGLGGNFEVPGVATQFEEAYDATVVKVDPFAVADATACDPAVARPYALSFVPAMAALHVHLAEPAERVDFLALDAERRRPKSGFSVSVERLLKGIPIDPRLARIGFPRAVAALALVWILAIISILGHYAYAAWAVAADRSRVQARIDELDSADARIRRRDAVAAHGLLLRKLEARSAVAFARHGLDRVLLGICESVPDGVALESVAFAAGTPATLALAGSTKIYDRLLKFNEKLAKTPDVAKVVVRRSEQVEDRVLFRFECELSAAKEAAR